MGASKKEAEFPLLAAQGLYVTNTTGNGNCLFNALSDQIHGDESLHSILRSRVIDYMRKHDNYYKQFVEVHPGGGTRRNPKRKTAALDNNTRTAEDTDKAFQNYLNEMGKKGTYGDNLEISAFARAYKIDVRVHRKDGSNKVLGGPIGVERPLAHIAYHDYEHYSSVRSVTGSSKGFANITPPITLSPTLLPTRSRKTPSPSPDQDATQHLSSSWAPSNPHLLPTPSPSPSPSHYTSSPSPPPDPQIVELIIDSLPHLSNRATISKILSECNNDVNAAVSRLLDLEDAGLLAHYDLDSHSSTPASTSPPGSEFADREANAESEEEDEEEEEEEEEEEIRGPERKRKDRRMSRVTRRAMLLATDVHDRDDQAADREGSRSRFSSPARILERRRRREKRGRESRKVAQVGKENSPSVPDLHVLSI